MASLERLRRSVFIGCWNISRARDLSCFSCCSRSSILDRCPLRRGGRLRRECLWILELKDGGVQAGSSYDDAGTCASNCTVSCTAWYIGNAVCNCNLDIFQA